MMNFDDSFLLDNYSNNANKQFVNMQSRLSEIENSFQTRMDGKTTIGLVISLVGTIAWLAVFIVCIAFVSDKVDSTIFIISIVIVIGLMLFMMIDNILDFLYYGKIASYRNSVSRLKNRVDIGKNSIKANHDAFMDSKTKGWNYPLKAALSIPEEATSVETTMTSMESLKKGFISVAKNILYYATVIAVTVVGCIVLFPTGSFIVKQVTGENFSQNTLDAFNVIALIIVCIGEIIVSKFAWSRTDCNVTNKTLLTIVLGPIAFLALIIVASLLVMLIIWIVGIVITILLVVAIIAGVFAATSGG